MMNTNARMMFVFLLFVLSSHADSSSCIPGFESDPLCRMQYNNEIALTELFNDATKALRENENLNLMKECTASSDINSFAASMITNSFLAIFIVAMAVALLYIAGNFFSLPNVLAMAKQELNELFITAIIAVFLIGVLSSSTLVQSIFGINLFDEATNYSYKMLYKISSMSGAMISANILLNSIYSLFVPIGPIRMAMTIQLGPALRPLIDAVSFSLQFLITTYGEWSVFVFMFCFIQKWFMPFFFPAGLFLRAFPQTRGGGNAILGIAIALSTIYPLMFYIGSRIYSVQFPESTFGTIEHYFREAVFAIFGQLSMGGILSLFGAFTLIYSSPVMISAILLIVYMFLDMMKDLVHLIIIFSILLPVLNIFVTLVFAREVAKMLGTEINISAFAKLI